MSSEGKFRYGQNATAQTQLRSLSAFLMPLTLLCVTTFILSGMNGPSGRDQLVLKMKTIIIPKIEFTEVPLPEALNFLRAEARKHDPQKTGVNIVLLTREESPPKITLKLNNLSLSSSLGFITELTGYVYEVRQEAIVISKPSPQGKKQAFNPRLQTEIYELNEGLKNRLLRNP